jgi:hypothetical protein
MRGIRLRTEVPNILKECSAMKTEQQAKKPYTPPRLTELGTVREVVLGSAAHDTADMNTARYY